MQWLPSCMSVKVMMGGCYRLQLVRSNSRRFMPSQADEEVHQLSYLHKHIGNILSLLADSSEGEGDDSLEHIADRVSPKENGPSSSDQDVQMADVGTTLKPSSSTRGPSFIEGVSKSSCVKQASDLKGTSVKVVKCHESVIYILAPLKYATVYGCSDATIVIGAVGKQDVSAYETVENVYSSWGLISNLSFLVTIINCRWLHIIFYSQLGKHVNLVGVDPNINRWDESITLGAVDPHDSLSHPAGVSDAQAESATRLDPDQFIDLVIPNWLEGDQSGSTKDNPFPLPEIYLASKQKNAKSLEEVKQILKESQLEENRKRELSSALHSCFKDWLYGNVWLYVECLHKDIRLFLQYFIPTS
ncbi:hypothetical protein SASPL_141004 [Salvia splendens]|uniref:C-CAP/cofactor C-like domain-containing protein n=1 Tax=Salvia splendens TaxID=180675 RepID=A0A8X8ZCG1_SALSN|nr:hypothetical protein SASPL_141004 [Salvia splendens]